MTQNFIIFFLMSSDFINFFLMTENFITFFLMGGGRRALGSGSGSGLWARARGSGLGLGARARAVGWNVSRFKWFTNFLAFFEILRSTRFSHVCTAWNAVETHNLFTVSASVSWFCWKCFFKTFYSFLKILREIAAFCTYVFLLFFS